MKSKEDINKQSPEEHFIKRAHKYDRSAKWVGDKELIEKIFSLTEAGPEDHVLDIAVGTGMISRAFYRKVKYLTGLDITMKMAGQAQEHTDKLVLSKAEEMPFDDMSFDVCVCRQGLQFMDLEKVFPQIYRVLKHGGRVVFSHLTAYDARDKETVFLIKSLRNPARKNFFMPEDFTRLLNKYNFSDIECYEHISVESVNRWIDNGAISEAQMEEIRSIYRNASDEFKTLHNIEFRDGDIFDAMKMYIVKGTKK